MMSLFASVQIFWLSSGYPWRQMWGCGEIYHRRGRLLFVLTTVAAASRLYSSSITPVLLTDSLSG